MCSCRRVVVVVAHACFFDDSFSSQETTPRRRGPEEPNEIRPLYPSLDDTGSVFAPTVSTKTTTTATTTTTRSLSTLSSSLSSPSCSTTASTTTTSSSSISSSTSSSSSSSTSTSRFSKLDNLVAPHQPVLFRDLFDARSSSQLRSHVAESMFVRSTRRYLELANGASAETPRTLLDRTRLSLDDVIDTQLTSSVFMPAHYIAVENELRAIVLAIRSTKSLSDLMTDYSYSPVRFEDGWAHDGMARAAHWFKAHALPRLAALREAYPGYRVRIVGHRYQYIS